MSCSLNGDLMPQPHAPLRMSRILLFVSEWLQDLGNLLFSCIARSQDWRTLLYKSDQGVEVFVRKGARIKSIGATQSGNTGKGLTRIRAKAPRRGVIVLRLAADQVLAKTVSLPAAAEDVIVPVLRNQMDRMTPWSQEQATFGYEIKERDRETGKLAVSVVASSQETIDDALEEVRSAHFSPSLIDHADGPMRGTGTVLALLDQSSKKRARQLVTRSLGALLFIAFLSFVVGTWDVYRYQLALHETEQRTMTARQQIAAARLKSRRNEKFEAMMDHLINLKSSRPSAFIMIEVLSRQLPDEVSLERLELDLDNVRLVGEGRNTASLIALLEGTEHFSSVRFSAPTTRLKQGRKERFTITARPLPVFEIRD